MFVGAGLSVWLLVVPHNSGVEASSARQVIGGSWAQHSAGTKIAVLKRLELELELIQSHMAQKPMLRGEVGARVRVIRACGQRRERRYGRARWCKAPG